MADKVGNADPVEGAGAHDDAVPTRPLPIGGRANLNEPAAVADDDLTHAWMDLLGRLVVISGHPNPETPIVVVVTASGDTQIIATPGASLSLYINKITLINGDTAQVVAQLQENGSAVNKGGGNLASKGGGVNLDFGSRGWKLTANTALDLNMGGSGSVTVSVTEYYIAA